MGTISNQQLLKNFITALYQVAGRRTTTRFADETIGTSIKTLETRYDFLKHIHINNPDPLNNTTHIHVSPDIDSIPPSEIGKAIESLIRIIYNDLDDEAGLYFIKELKQYTGEEITRDIQQYDVDLDQLQMEQHIAYQQRERKKPNKPHDPNHPEEPYNPLGYTWDNVGSWKHEPGSSTCILYDKNGGILDRLNLDTIIQDYIERLSGYAGKETSELTEEIPLFEQEYRLLELMYQQDMDIETAAHLLHLPENLIRDIIKKLIKIEMLHYSAYDEVTLTNKGINYLHQNKEE